MDYYSRGKVLQQLYNMGDNISSCLDEGQVFEGWFGEKVKEFVEGCMPEKPNFREDEVRPLLESAKLNLPKNNAGHFMRMSRLLIKDIFRHADTRHEMCVEQWVSDFKGQLEGQDFYTQKVVEDFNDAANPEEKKKIVNDRLPASETAEKAKVDDISRKEAIVEPTHKRGDNSIRKIQMNLKEEPERVGP